MKLRGPRPTAALLALLVAATPATAGSPASIAELLQSPENLEYLVAPERVEICILTPKDPLFRKKSGKRRYIEGAYKPVPATEARKLAGRLADNAIYRWDTDSARVPVWNARVKFIRGDTFLSADFCYAEDLVLFGRDGLPFAAEDFRDPNGEFLALARSLFPKERVLHDAVAVIETRRREREAVERAIEKKAAEAAARHSSSTP